MNLTDKNLLITGGSGTLGSNFPFGKKISSKDCDLKNQQSVDNLFASNNFEYVCHCAAIVGGLGYHLNPNSQYDLYHSNLMINSNVLHYAKKHKVKKILAYLSSCIYSDNCPLPYTEKMIYDGPPSPVHFAYAHAKRSLLIQSQIIRDLNEMDVLGIIPTNIYGMGDDFCPERSHFIAALVLRAYEASKTGEKFIVWGSGKQRRDVIYTEDIVNISLYLLENYSDREPVIISSNSPVEVGYIAELIAKEFSIEKQLMFDTSKPVGQENRVLSGDKLKSIIDYKFTSVEDGIKKTCEWFKSSYPNIRL